MNLKKYIFKKDCTIPVMDRIAIDGDKPA